MPAWTSNEVPFVLVPKVAIEPKDAPEGDLALTVTCTPRIREGQRIVLLFGESQVRVQTVDTPADESLPTTLDFPIFSVKKGSYLVRLRIDGADSLPIILTGTPPRLEFDPSQKVTIT